MDEAHCDKISELVLLLVEGLSTIPLVSQCGQSKKVTSAKPVSQNSTGRQSQACTAWEHVRLDPLSMHSVVGPA